MGRNRFCAGPKHLDRVLQVIFNYWATLGCGISIEVTVNNIVSTGSYQNCKHYPIESILRISAHSIGWTFISPLSDIIRLLTYKLHIIIYSQNYLSGVKFCNFWYWNKFTGSTLGQQKWIFCKHYRTVCIFYSRQIYYLVIKIHT